MLGLEAEQTATYVGERDTANARVVDEAQNAEIAFVPAILRGAQRNRVTRTVQNAMPKRESARRLVDRAVLERPVVPPLKVIMSNGAVNSLRQV